MWHPSSNATISWNSHQVCMSLALFICLLPFSCFYIANVEPSMPKKVMAEITLIWIRLWFHPRWICSVIMINLINHCILEKGIAPSYKFITSQLDLSTFSMFEIILTSVRLWFIPCQDLLCHHDNMWLSIVSYKKGLHPPTSSSLHMNNCNVKVLKNPKGCLFFRLRSCQ